MSRHAVGEFIGPGDVPILPEGVARSGRQSRERNGSCAGSSFVRVEPLWAAVIASRGFRRLFLLDGVDEFYQIVAPESMLNCRSGFAR